MERKDLKLWARKEANNHRWQIWKCLLIILLVTLGLIVSLILIFNWLLSLKTTSIIGVLDFVIVLAILLAYLFSAGFSTQFYCYIKEIINNGNSDLNLLKTSFITYIRNGFICWLIFFIDLLGMFLFILPGIFLLIKFLPVPYLLANHQEMNVIDILKTSWQMMSLNKMKDLLLLILSFAGWFILGIFTFLIGFIWALPYFLLALSRFFIILETEYFGLEEIQNEDNSKEIQEFALLNNLDVMGNNIYGLFNDFPVVIKVLPENTIIKISIAGNKRSRIDNYFAKLERLGFLKTINYSNDIITISIISQNLNNVYETLKNITMIIRKIGYQPACCHCHCNKPVSFCLYHGEIVYVCKDCFNELKNKQSVPKEKYSIGFLGAVLGALLGGLIWILIYQFTAFGRITGYIIALLAILGYQKFAGRLSLSGLIISGLCSVVSLLVAEFFGLSLQIFLATRIDSLIQAIILTPNFIMHSDIIYLVVKDILFGLCFIAIAFIQYSYSLTHTEKKPNIVKLDKTA